MSDRWCRRTLISVSLSSNHWSIRGCSCYWSGPSCPPSVHLLLKSNKRSPLQLPTETGGHGNQSDDRMEDLRGCHAVAVATRYPGNRHACLKWPCVRHETGTAEQLVLVLTWKNSSHVKQNRKSDLKSTSCEFIIFFYWKHLQLMVNTSLPVEADKPCHMLVRSGESQRCQMNIHFLPWKEVIIIRAEHWLILVS